MLSVTSSFSARPSGSAALQLLQSVTINPNGGPNGGDDTISARLWLTTSPTSNAAIDTLIRIILDAQGNAEVEIEAEGGMAAAKTAGGDDKISITAGGVFGVSSGAGNDAINIAASGIRAKKDSDLPAVFNVDGGSGEDQINITAGGDVWGVYGGEGSDAITVAGLSRTYSFIDGIDIVDGGEGNDTIRLASAGNIDRIYGGAGNDVIDLKSGETVWRTDGGDGDDTISVEAKQVYGISGGAGNDTVVINADHAEAKGGDGDDRLQISARSVLRVEGGDGNDNLIINAVNANGVDGGHGDDIIVVNAEKGISVSGGRGNDHITLTSAADTAAVFNYAKGDGNDVIVANSPLEIRSFSSDGTQQLDMRDASISFDGDTLTIGFAGTRDTITVKLGGRMAEGGDIHLVYEKFSKSLVIADDRMMEEMARRQAQLPKPQGPAVLTLAR